MHINLLYTSICVKNMCSVHMCMWVCTNSVINQMYLHMQCSSYTFSVEYSMTQDCV